MPDLTDELDVSAPGHVGCCPCGHDDAAHDAIARRYCGATITGNLERGCICAPFLEAGR
jgi:hypothetical protein